MLLLGLAVVLIFYFTREPHYKGRSLSEWVADLNNGNYHQQTAAMEAIRAIGPKAVPYLSGEVEDRQSRVRDRVRRIGRAFPERVRAVGRKLFGSKTVMDRVAAAKALELLGTNASGAVPSLTNALRDQNQVLQNFASKALATMPDAVPGLVAALDDPDISIRSHAALALRALGPQASNAVPRLVQIMRSEVGQIVHVASYALSGIGQPAIPLLTDALGDTNAAVRKQVALTLGNMEVHGLLAVPALVAAAHDPDPSVREAIIQALGKIDRTTPEADETLVAALSDSNEAVRAHAMEALVFRPRAIRQNFAKIESLQEDANEKVRAAARTAVENYKEKVQRRPDQAPVQNPN